MDAKVTPVIQLRPVAADDLPWMYECQLDPVANAMAVVIPRSKGNFFHVWHESLTKADVHAYMIEFEGQRSGWVSCFPAEGVMSIGYVIVRELWGRGIATEALRLLLLKDLPQPLYARIATTNVASRRVLEKNGFKVIQQEWMPECERYPASDTYLLQLEDSKQPISPRAGN